MQPGLAQEVIRQNVGRLAPGRENLIEIRTFTISGETKPVLYEHPVYERLPFRTTITPATREFSFSVAMQPAVYDGTMPLCGAGVRFRLEIRDSAGRIRLLYDRYIDPKHNLAERRWIPGSVDLNEYMGQNVELLFTTTGEPPPPPPPLCPPPPPCWANAEMGVRERPMRAMNPKRGRTLNRRITYLRPTAAH